MKADLTNSSLFQLELLDFAHSCISFFVQKYILGQIVPQHAWTKEADRKGCNLMVLNNGLVFPFSFL